MEEEIMEQHLLIRGRDFAAFSTIEKPLAGRKKTFRGPNAARWSYGVQACTKPLTKKPFADTT